MKKILLLGATGQLGNNIAQKLFADGHFAVRALVREDSPNRSLLPNALEIVTGDLTRPEGLGKAVEGCDYIIATANAVAPRKKGDSFQTVDIQGYRNLIDLAVKNNCAHFIYISLLPMPGKFASWSPLSEAKAQTEAYLKKSGLNYTIVQPAGFMDVYFAFMGSSVLTAGTPAHLVNRPWQFMRQFFNGIKNDIAKGKIGIIGNGLAKQRYIAVDNVAEFVIKAVDNSFLMNKTIPLGGPEALSSLDVKARFEKILNKELKIKRTPAFLMKWLGNIFGLFNPAISNIFKLNYLAATYDYCPDSRELAQQLEIRLISAEEFLKSRLQDK